MKIKYQNRYKITDECKLRIYPDVKDAEGNIKDNDNLRYCYAEPDKKMNEEYWLMDENGIVNPYMYTAILSENELEEIQIV